MVAFTAGQRTKELGIRKVFGASVGQIAYHIELSWLIFAASGLFALIVVVATVSYQAISAAKADPGERIRYE